MQDPWAREFSGAVRKYHSVNLSHRTFETVEARCEFTVSYGLSRWNGEEESGNPATHTFDSQSAPTREDAELHRQSIV